MNIRKWQKARVVYFVHIYVYFWYCCPNGPFYVFFISTRSLVQTSYHLGGISFTLICLPWCSRERSSRSFRQESIAQNAFTISRFHPSIANTILDKHRIWGIKGHPSTKLFMALLSAFKPFKLSKFMSMSKFCRYGSDDEISHFSVQNISIRYHFFSKSQSNSQKMTEARIAADTANTRGNFVER